MGVLIVTHRRFFWATIVLVGTLVFGLSTILYSALIISQPHNAKISWTPSVLNVTVPAGTSNIYKLSFIASENIDNAALRVVPELQPYVYVSPASFQSIIAGKPVSVDMIVKSSTTTLPQTNNGVIQLRGSDGKNGTIPVPLPVSVTVQWQQVTQNSMGISLSYPPTYIPTLDVNSNLQEIGFSENQDARDSGIAPELVVSTHMLSQGQSVRDWIHTFGVSDQNIIEISIGGQVYLKWSDLGGEGDENSTSYSRLGANNRALTFTVFSDALNSDPALNSIISSVVFITQ
jgi:hypothetical protein